MKIQKKLSITTLSLVLLLAVFGGTTSASTTSLSYGGSKVITGDFIEASEVITDSNKNIYTVGEFSPLSSQNFNPDGSDTKTSGGGTDMYITKTNSDGSYAWTKTFGGAGNDDLLDIAVDSSNNFYVVGYFRGSNVNLNPDGSTLFSSAGPTITQSFVSKYSAAGTHQWTKSYGGSQSSQAVGIEVANDGSLYLATTYSGTVDFNPDSGVDNHTALSSTDLNSAITKFNSNGDYLWTKAISSTELAAIDSIDSDSSGNIYLGGSFYGDIDLDPGAATASASTGVVDLADSFVVKLNSSGDYVWSKAFGGSAADPLTGLSVHGDSVFIAGYFSSASVNFNPGGSDSQSKSGSYSLYLSKWSTSGSYGWTKVIGNNTASPENITTDSIGNVYITGIFSGTNVNFDPGGSDLKSTESGEDYFFTSRWDNDGSYGWTKTNLKGDFAFAQSVTVDKDMDVYTVGYNFGDATGTNYNPDGSDIKGALGTFEYDLFRTKWDQTITSFINNAPSGLDIVDENGNSIVNDGTNAGTSVNAQIKSTANIPITDIQLNLSDNIDFSSVTAGTDIATGKAFVHGLAAAGAVGTHSLYVPKLAGQNMVTICPNATSLAEVSPTCQNAQNYTASSPNVQIRTVGSQEYWVVSGLTGTGGIGGQLSSNAGLTSAPNTGLEQTPMLRDYGLISLGVALALIGLRATNHAKTNRTY